MNVGPTLGYPGVPGMGGGRHRLGPRPYGTKPLWQRAWHLEGSGASSVIPLSYQGNPKFNLFHEGQRTEPRKIELLPGASKEYQDLPKPAFCKFLRPCWLQILFGKSSTKTRALLQKLLAIREMAGHQPKLSSSKDLYGLGPFGLGLGPPLSFSTPLKKTNQTCPSP